MHRQGGQIVPVVLAVLFFGLAAVVVSYNSGQQLIQKSRVVNAADAAAYSGGAWAARRMNFIAYTNRAMIANHVAVGHLVTFLSWIRYVEDVASTIEKIAVIVPIAEAAAQWADRIAEAAVEGTEIAGAVNTPTMDEINHLYSLAQREARLDLSASRLDGVMRSVVRQHDARMSLNERTALRKLPLGYAKAALSQYARGRGRLIAAIKSYVPYEGEDNSDGGRMQAMVERTIDDNGKLAHWQSGEPRGGANGIGNGIAWYTGKRGWSKGQKPILKITKKGVTGSRFDGDGATWQADDKMYIQHYDVSDQEWGGSSTIGQGAAKVSDFDAQYRGITEYKNLDYQDKGNPKFPVVAAVTLPRDEAAAQKTFSMRRDESPIGYVSQAIVAYNRPRPCAGRSRRGREVCAAPLRNGNAEFAHLFSPFWQASLGPAAVSP